MFARLNAYDMSLLRSLTIFTVESYKHDAPPALQAKRFPLFQNAPLNSAVWKPPLRVKLMLVPSVPFLHLPTGGLN
jgi:hypothetical protein